MRGSSLKVCSALPAELDSFLKETVSYRIEAILEARCPYGEDFEDLGQAEVSDRRKCYCFLHKEKPPWWILHLGG